jgi:Reverse transcriptase (RNA-dependent DNA polymerase)
LSVNDFRGISISPVISKLFEMSVFEKCSDHFITSDHQFGFKKHLGCREAIYSVRNVIETFIANGSTVNVCTLDLSKAFDRMNHFSLFSKLMKRQIPDRLLSILELWFGMSCVLR